MGCRNSTEEPPAPPVQDLSLTPDAGMDAQAQECLEKVGLNPRQVFTLNKSWKGVQRNLEDTGVDMFIRLFKSNSDLKSLFQGFKDLKTDDELRSNEALENHATLVMTTLDDAITHIDNFDYVSEVLRKTGASHHRFEGFNSENFWQIKDPFLDAVKVTLEDRYTDNMEAIYKIAITFILKTMVEGMEDHRNSNANTIKAADT